MAQAASLPHARGRSSTPLRGVGYRGRGREGADEFFAELDPELAVEPPQPETDEIQAEPPDASHPEPDVQDREPRVGERAAQLRAISMDMGPGYAKSARNHAPQATVCIDPYHVVQLANKALDDVRRGYWNELRAPGDQDAAKRFKDARWSLLKAPKNLTDKQDATLRRLKAAGGEAWRGYTLKEAARGIFEHGLTLDDVTVLIDRLLSRLARSRLEPFVRLGKTIRKHRDGILAAIRLRINQGSGRRGHRGATCGVGRADARSHACCPATSRWSWRSPATRSTPSAGSSS